MSNLKIDEILRYMLAGGVAILAVWLGYREPGEWFTEKHENALITFVFIALPVMIGALAYVLHRAVLYPPLYIFMAWRTGRTEPTLQLDIARWKHLRASGLGTLQDRMGEWAAQLHFLYASSWAVGVANLVAVVGGWTHSRWFYMQLGLFPVLLGAALIHHWRYQKWEAAVFRHDTDLLQKESDRLAAKSGDDCAAR